MPQKATDAHCHIGGISTAMPAAVCAINETQWKELENAQNPLLKKVYGLFLGEALSHTDAQIESAVQSLEKLCREASAIGEFGLDKRFTSVLPFHRQERIFDAHVALSVSSGLPCVLHCVGAWGFLLKKLKAAKRAGAGAFLLHSAGCAPELAREFMRLDCYFSFSKRQLTSRKGLETAAAVPPERLLLESDDIPSPARYAEDLEVLSKIGNYAPDELSDIIFNNFNRLFR